MNKPLKKGNVLSKIDADFFLENNFVKSKPLFSEIILANFPFLFCLVRIFQSYSAVYFKLLWLNLTFSVSI